MTDMADTPEEPSSFSTFIRSYQQRFIAAIEGWDQAALARLAEVLSAARERGATVLLAGNGGSAAVANHTECDGSKGTYHGGIVPLNTRSLSANPSVLTAIGNDLGFAYVFDKQVEYYGRPGDVLLLISSSGNSPNVVNACKAARAKGMVTVALVGFKGGALKDLADHVLHIPVENYGIVEDMHQASLHLVTQYLAMVFNPHRAEPATPPAVPLDAE
jgi:phosphoheptose isomerase